MNNQVPHMNLIPKFIAMGFCVIALIIANALANNYKSKSQICYDSMQYVQGDVIETTKFQKPVIITKKQQCLAKRIYAINTEWGIQDEVEEGQIIRKIN